MSLVQPAQPHATLLDTPRGLEIAIPSKRNWFVLVFLGAWLVGWFFGEISVAGALLSGAAKEGQRLFMLVWITGWTLGGVMALLFFLWQLAGVERVILGPSTLTIRRELFGVGRSQEYELSTVRNLRAAQSVYNPFDPRSSLQFWGIGGGLIAFDHGAATIRFGAAIQEAEATAIVNRMLSRHSFPA